MSFKAGRLFAAALVVCLFIQMQIAVNGYASRITKIAFTSWLDGNFDIYVMDGDGSNQRRVTVNPAKDHYPAWSPDGTKILYVTHLVPEDHNLAPGGITVMDADGKDKRLVNPSCHLRRTGAQKPSFFRCQNTRLAEIRPIYL